MADVRGDPKGAAGEQELRREAARIFPKLANDAGYLEKLGENVAKYLSYSAFSPAVTIIALMF